MKNPSQLNRLLLSSVRIIALASFVLLRFLSVSQAAYQDLDWGARPTGMGGAFSAIADDSNAPLYNPAGIVQIQWNELSASYANLYSGLNLYSGNDTTGNDTVQLNQSYLAFAARPIPHIGSFEISWANFNATHLYREDTVILTYARNLGDFFPVLDNALSIGTNLKYLSRSVTLDSLTTNDPVFSGGNSQNAISVDAGALYTPHEGLLSGLRLALVGKDLNQPDVGFQATDKVPSEVRIGAAYQAKDLPWLVPSLDLSRRGDNTGVAAGLESWLLHNTLGLRGGVNRDEGAAGLSYFQKLGTRFGMRLDYAFTVPFYVDGSGGSHRLTLALYF